MPQGEAGRRGPTRVFRVPCAIVAAVVVSMMAPGSAPAADECISQAVKDRAAVCPAPPAPAPAVTPAPAPAISHGPPDPASKGCTDQALRVDQIRKLGDADAILRELDRLLDVYNKIEKENHPATTKYQCANMTAARLSEIAMDWHLRAIGSGHETNRRNKMKLAVLLYMKILDRFTAEQMASFQFPRLAPIDWPSRWRIQYAVADLHYFLKDWANCGPAFDAVVAGAPDKRAVDDAVFAAALCYYNRYEATHPPVPPSARRLVARESPRDFTATEQAMMAAWNRFLCMIPAQRKDAESLEFKAQLKGARGNMYVDAGHWEEAALDLRDAAMSGADVKGGALSALSYLEAKSVVGTVMTPQRPSCYEEMADDLDPLVDSYCRGKNGRDNAAVCAILIQAARDGALRENAGSCNPPRQQSGVDPALVYKSGALFYMDIWRKYAAEPCADGLPACEGSEFFLYYAAKAYQLANMTNMALSVRQTLAEPKNGLSSTELGKRAVYEMGEDYKRLGNFEEAAQWYERFVAASPEMPEAPKALHQAIVLRLGLLQPDRAQEDANLFAIRYGATRPALAVEINLALARHFMGE